MKSTYKEHLDDEFDPEELAAQYSYKGPNVAIVRVERKDRKEKVSGRITGMEVQKSWKAVHLDVETPLKIGSLRTTPFTYVFCPLSPAK